MKGKLKIVRLSSLLAVFLIVAVVQASSGFELVTTILSPTPTVDGFFGEAVAAVGDRFIIGERGNCPPCPGAAVHVFDSDGNQVMTISSPTVGSEFGWAVGGVGTNLLVSAIRDNTAAEAAGAAYLFDGATGGLLHTFLNPNPEMDFAFNQDNYGWSVAGIGNFALVGSPGEDLGTLDAGVVYVFDAATGALVQTILNPTPELGDRFGTEIAVVGNKIAVAAFEGTESFNGGAVYVFDASGNLLTTIRSPQPIEGNGFGRSMAAFGDNVLVGEAGGFSGDVQNSGVVHLFDTTTGALIRTFLNPTPDTFEVFGWAVAASGNHVVVGSLRDHKGKTEQAAAYVFDGTTGELMDKLTNPEPSLSVNSFTVSYAFDVAALGERVLISSPYQTTVEGNISRAGVAYLYQPKKN